MTGPAQAALCFGAMPAGTSLAEPRVNSPFDLIPEKSESWVSSQPPPPQAIKRKIPLCTPQEEWKPHGSRGLWLKDTQHCFCSMCSWEQDGRQASAQQRRQRCWAGAECGRAGSTNSPPGCGCWGNNSALLAEAVTLFSTAPLDGAYCSAHVSAEKNLGNHKSSSQLIYNPSFSSETAADE